VTGVSTVRPILRWAGSKRKLLPTLLRAVPKNFTRYVEPFVGSACLFFALQPPSAILSDINPHLIDTYSTIREHPIAVSNRVRKLKLADYYRIRDLRPDELTSIDRATRFVYLNRHCFNGVYRTNRAGWFNVPMGNKTGGLPDRCEFVACSNALRGVSLIAGDFANTVFALRKGDFVYLDPPYANSQRPESGEYGYGTFRKGDHNRLLRFLSDMDHSKVMFLLSYANDAQLVRRLSAKWNVVDLSVRRHVAGFAKNRRQAAEILVSNYSASNA
jgi:DNA adenine methylase